MVKTDLGIITEKVGTIAEKKKDVHMNNFFQTLLLPYISQLGMTESNDHLYNKCGTTFSCNSDIAEGFCWGFSYNNNFSISVYDVELQESVSPKYNHPEFYTIGFSSESASQYILGNAKKRDPIIRYSCPEGTFCETFKKGTHVYSSALGFSPDFLKSLAKHYELNYSDFINTCFNPSENLVISNAEFILKQIFSAKPLPNYAAMYYEGKILELLSGLAQWQINNQKYILNGVSSDDSIHLNDVVDYLQQNYAKPIRINELEAVAYMGKNKLSHIFKIQYGSTITTYLRELRMEHAKDILYNTTLPVGSVAAMVGYQNQGSFAECFKAETGFTPTEYRRALKSSSKFFIVLLSACCEM